MAIESEAAFASIITPVFSELPVAWGMWRWRPQPIDMEALCGRLVAKHAQPLYRLELPSPAPHDLKLPHYAAEMWVSTTTSDSRANFRSLQHRAAHTFQHNDLPLGVSTRPMHSIHYEPKKPWQDFLPLPGGIGPGDWSPNSESTHSQKGMSPGERIISTFIALAFIKAEGITEQMLTDAFLRALTQPAAQSI